MELVVVFVGSEDLPLRAFVFERSIFDTCPKYLGISAKTHCDLSPFQTDLSFQHTTYSFCPRLKNDKHFGIKPALTIQQKTHWKQWKTLESMKANWKTPRKIGKPNEAGNVLGKPNQKHWKILENPVKNTGKPHQKPHQNLLGKPQKQNHSGKSPPKTLLKTKRPQTPKTLFLNQDALRRIRRLSQVLTSPPLSSERSETLEIRKTKSGDMWLRLKGDFW